MAANLTCLWCGSSKVSVEHRETSGWKTEFLCGCCGEPFSYDNVVESGADHVPYQAALDADQEEARRNNS